MADLDANLRRQPARRCGGREVDLAEPALADEAVQPVGATGLGATGFALLSHATYLRRVRAAVKPTNCAPSDQTGRNNSASSSVKGWPASAGRQTSRSLAIAGNSASGVHTSTRCSLSSTTQYTGSLASWYRRRFVKRSARVVEGLNTSITRRSERRRDQSPVRTSSTGTTNTSCCTSTSSRPHEISAGDVSTIPTGSRAKYSARAWNSRLTRSWWPRRGAGVTSSSP